LNGKLSTHALALAFALALGDPWRGPSLAALAVFDEDVYRFNVTHSIRCP
jgi:hypothetical protein